MTAWQETVLKSAGLSSLQELEAPLPGGDQTYPLLGGEESVSTDLREEFTWRVRVVLVDEPDSEYGKVFREAAQEVRVGTSLEVGEPLSSCLKVTRFEDTAEIQVDLLLLRNLAEIRRLKAAHPDVREWTLVSEGERDDDPERLVGETLRQVTGVVGGCRVIEIRQGEKESLHGVWERVCVAKLLATEADLFTLPDVLAGAGFFSTLAARLNH